MNPLQSDEDAPLDALMAARVRASLSWGHLQGRLAHVPLQVAHHFCCALTRLLLVEALGHSGFPGAEGWFTPWFCGLEPVPDTTVQATAPASLVADTLLSELSLCAWSPLAQAAAQIRAAARFDRDDRSEPPEILPAFAVEQAARLAELLARGNEDDWPLTPLDRLHGAAADSPHFAPPERNRQLLALPSGPMVFEQTRPGMALWALDLVAGPLIARANPGARPLPLPGTVRAEALRPELWPRERAILVAQAAGQAAQRLCEQLDAAHARVQDMQQPLSGLRSTSRAPLLYRLLAGFGPLRPLQIEQALAVSKNGVRDLVASLVHAGLAETSLHRHQTVVRALPPRRAPTVPATEHEELPDSPYAEHDAAMADLDRLLARSDASRP
ncbi:hypothetical protein K426_01150 [Sphingobium sp. TKS]|nr:hypothetical protein K426_01150 [Sphingobium sp. TKS]